MNRWLVGLLFAGVAVTATAQETRRYDPVQSFSEFAAYSNDSSHILLAESFNRRLLTIGGGYNRRIVGNSILSWRYQAEVLPVVLLSDPYRTLTVTNTVVGNPITVPFQPGTSTNSGFITSRCMTGTGAGNYYVNNVVVGTYTYSQTCSMPWTFGGGISPLGQKINFMPRRRVQPYIAANAGFLFFTQPVPSNGATMFNFTFEAGGGVEFYSKPGRSWAIDLRVHHLSNAYTAVENPGVDSAMVRLAYSFTR